MPKAENERLHRWMTSLSAAIEALEHEVGVTLDFSRGSLQQIWDVLPKTFAYRDLDNRGTDPLVSTPEDVPEWASQPGMRRERMMMTPRTLESMGNLARYYGECLTHSSPDAKWVIWHWNVAGAAVSGEGQPALTIPDSRTELGGRSAVFPLRDISVLTNRLLSHSEESTSITSTFDMRIEELTEAVRQRDAERR
jgi:hypothetical protein